MSLLKYLQVLRRWSVWILLVMFISVASVAIKGFMEPRMYRATVTILSTPSGASSSFGPLGQVFGFSGLKGDSLESVIRALILSRRTAKDISEYFKLADRYPAMSCEKIWQKVSGMLDVNLGEKGILVDAVAEDPKLAADIANFAVVNLDAINEELNISSEKPFVRVLDPALLPLAPMSRKIILRSFIALLISAAGGMVAAFFVTYFRNLMARESERELEKQFGMEKAPLEMTTEEQ